MNLIKKTSIISLILFLILYFFPWWTGSLCCLIIGYISVDIKSSIQLTSFGLTTSWAVILIYRWIIGGDIIMARVATMMNVNNSIMLAIIILIIPIIIGGISGLTGKLIRDALD